MLRFLLATTMFFPVFTGAAHAMPAALGGIGALIGGAAAGGISFGSIALGIASMAAQWLISKMLTPDQKQRGVKDKIEVGGDNPPRIIVGEYATPGQLVYRNTLNKGSNIPNACLVDVICLGVLPSNAVSNKVFINNEGCHLNTGSNWSGFMEVTEYVKGGDKGGYCLMKFHLGGQTDADTWLLDKFGSDPDRPWKNTMFLPGCTYAIVQSWYSNRGIWSGWPTFRFVLQGLKLYDPRKDSTVGGSGSQRWGNQNTWTFSKNAKVIEYNVIRGLYWDGKHQWGGHAEAYRLPLDYWFAAMNVCDETITKKNGDVIRRYEIGAEISFSDKPIEIVNEINKSCDGYTTEFGGTYKTWCGGPGLPVATITDDDFLISEEQELNRFQTQQNTFNTVYTTYPEPRQQWEVKDGPRYQDADALAADGEELALDLALPFVSENNQVQRLARSAGKDSRRETTHGGQLPPIAWTYEPFDVLAYLSSRFGYGGTGKTFQLSSKDDLPNVNQAVLLREVDPDDHGWLPAFEQDYEFSPLTVVKPGDLELVVTAYADTVDGPGGKDKPAIRAEWAPDDGGPAPDDIDIRYIDWRVRRTGSTKIIARGKIEAVEAGEALISSAAFRFGRSYDVQFRPVPFANRGALWGDWQTVVMLAVDVPANLTLAASSDLGKDGKLDFFVKANWDDVAQEKHGYGVKITVDGDDRYHRADDSRYKFPVKAPSTVQVAVRTRASDGGTPGAWCTPVTINVTKKSTAPTTPTQLAVVGKHRRAVIKTEDHPDDDFRRWCVYFSKTNNFTTATKSRHSRSNRFVVDDLDNGDTYYFWLTAEDTSGNESAKYPSSNTGGVSAVIAKLDDDDTDDAVLAAPTALALSKVQDTDEDGKVQTFLKMACTPPAWATSKTTYVFAVTVGADTFTVKSDDEIARYRVNKTGVLHTVKVRGVKGNGNKGSWSGNQTITPTKKAGSMPSPGTIAISAGKKRVKLDWVDVDDDVYPDYLTTGVWRNTTGTTPTPGVTATYKRTRAGYFIDDNITTGVNYRYWVAHMDRSRNWGSLSAMVSSASGGDEVSSFSDLSGSIASNQIPDNTINTDKILLGANSRVDENYTSAGYGTFGTSQNTIQSVVSHHRDNGAQDTNFALAIGSFRNTSGAAGVFDITIERASPVGDIVVATMPNYSIRDNEYATITGVVSNPGGDTVNGATNTFKLKVTGAQTGNNVANRRLQVIALRT